MIIDASNGEIINTRAVCIHDDILEEFCFNREEKKLHLTIIKAETDDKRVSIDFLHVIGFLMTSCDFWGCSPHIFDFEYVKHNDNVIIPKLFQKKDNDDCLICSLKEQEKYIETKMIFTSGDELIVACESVVI